MNHTPGNWSVEDVQSRGEGFAVASDHDFEGRAGTTHRRYVAQFMSEDDAMLIATVPAMHDALVKLYGAVCEHFQGFENLPDDLEEPIIEAFQALGEPGA